MEDSKTLFSYLKFPRARGRIFSKFMESLGTCLRKVSPALHYTLLYIVKVRYWGDPLPALQLQVCEDDHSPLTSV